MAHSHSIREYPGQLSAFMAVSAAVGAGAALLFTPRTGKQYREQIKLRAVTLKERLQRSNIPEAKPKTSTSHKTNRSASRRASPRGRTSRRTNLTAEQIRRHGEP